MTAMLSEVSRSGFAIGVEIVAKVTLVLLLTWITLIALRRASAALRHLVATVAICLTLFMPWLVRFGPQWRIPILPAPPSASTAISTIQAEEHTTPSISIAKNENVLHSGKHSMRQPESRGHTDSYSVSQQVQQSERVPLSRIAAPPQAVTPAQKMDWKLWMMATWLLGAFLAFGRLAFSHLRLRQIVRRARSLDDRGWTEMAQQIERDFDVHRPVRLWRSNEIEVPITTGIFYPKILLPVESEEWSVERRRVVLLHEFAHIRRFDAVTQWLAQIALAVYWFHPLVWWAARQMQSERERACDDFVLSAGAKASDYASDLLEFGSRARQPVAYGAALAMARRSQLEGRLLAVLDQKISRRSVSFRTAATVALVASAIALPITTLHAVAAQAPSQTAMTKNSQSQSLTPAGQQRPPFTPAPNAAESPESLPTPSTAPIAGTEPTADIDEAVPTAGPSEAPTGGVSQTGPTAPAAASPASTPAPGNSSNSYSYGYTTGGSENLQAFECRSDGHSMSDWVQSNNGHRTWKANWSGVGAGGERCQISLYAEGNIIFKTDLTGIQSISPGAFLEISEALGSHFRKLTAKANSAGNVELSWTVDGQAKALGDQERGWLAAFLLTLERQTAFSAETRVPALLQQGSPNAVLDEVNSMTGDYARSRYLLLMVENAKLNDAQLLRTIEFTGKSMTSDYEHARVLLALAKQYAMEDEGSRKAFLLSANGLKSDYEHARVLMELLKRPHLSVETRNSAIQSASNIRSDYERARVLMAATCDCNNVAPAPLPRVFFETVDGIHSDYEHGRVLLSILDNRKQQLSPEDAKAILQSATHIGSDYERRRVLTGLIERKLLSESLVPLFLEASESIQSGNDHSTVLIALINSGQLNASHLERLINSAASIHQDYELSRVLTTLASAYPLKANARSAYIKVAQQIHSEYERNRALAAVSTSTML
jgi:beta-lactamase regulating signal transducer with metallopeptidase domain